MLVKTNQFSPSCLSSKVILRRLFVVNDYMKNPLQSYLESVVISQQTLTQHIHLCGGKGFGFVELQNPETPTFIRD